MRAYSLVGVLAALVILMVVLVPVLHVHGRLYSQLDRDHTRAILAAIEIDVAALENRTRPPETKVLRQEPFTLKRTVVHEDGLYKMTYQATHGKKTFELSFLQ